MRIVRIFGSREQMMLKRTLYARFLSASLGLSVLPAFAGQDPSLNLQYAIPAAEEVSILESLPSSDSESQIKQSVSVRFTNAKAKEVFGWLQKKNVNFVVDDSQLPANKTITLNLQNQTMEDVLEAIGSALGGRFEKRKGIYVYQPGEGRMLLTPLKALDSTRMVLPRMRIETLPSREMSPAEKRKFDASMKKFEAEMKQFGEKMEKSFGPEFEKQFNSKEMELKLNKAFGPDFEKRMEEFGKSFEGMGKQFELHFKDFDKDFEKDFKDFDIDLKELKKLGETVEVTVKGKDVDELLKSMTPEQKKLQEERGYLLLKDLTASQRKHFPGEMKGKFEISIVKDGQKLTIKGE
jgi:hypothetical protein